MGLDVGTYLPGLSVAGLTRRTGGRTVLDGLDLAVPAGTLTAVLGASGSGKSTLMRVLAGFEAARGTVLFAGRDVARLPARRRGFGVVQQADALFAHITLADNVAFPLRVRGTPRADRQRLVAEMLDLVGLGHAAGARPADASAVDRQRAALARAAVFGPRLLLLDEPGGGLDPGGRADLLAGLDRIHRLLGATIVLATAEASDALAVADRIAVLRGGAIVQHGPPEEVWERPRNADVAALLGEMNRLPGTIEAVEGDIALVRLACGPLMEALLGRTLQAGDPCVLTLRPDRVALAPVPAAEMGEDAIDGTLVEARFEGHSWRLRLLIGSGAALVVRRPAAAGLRGLSPGQTAAIAWQAHHAWAFPEPAA